MLILYNYTADDIYYTRPRKKELRSTHFMIRLKDSSALFTSACIIVISLGSQYDNNACGIK